MVGMGLEGPPRTPEVWVRATLLSHRLGCSVSLGRAENGTAPILCLVTGSPVTSRWPALQKGSAPWLQSLVLGTSGDR